MPGSCSWVCSCCSFLALGNKHTVLSVWYCETFAGGYVYTALCTVAISDWHIILTNFIQLINYRNSVEKLKSKDILYKNV